MVSSSSSSPEIPAAPTQDPSPYKHATHEEVLEDLCSRFILNLPDEEFTSLERICFQVEQAHWFYEDFIREENPKFPSLPLKKFSAMLFQACPLLHHWSNDHERAFNNFMQYKTRVPVCGAIMLNETWEKCILVKGWKSSSGWGFPKGKINQGEPEHLCAIREVLEETGYNLAGQLNPDDVIELSIREQKISLYIVPNVPEDFEFETRTRKEISRIEWFKLTDLPTWKRSKTALGKFYLISPFIGPLKAFIDERKPRGLGKKSSKSKQSQSSPPHHNTDWTSSSYPAYIDTSAQESSSQSSSADNGDPQTPSPQTSEHNAPASHIVSAEESFDMRTIDPHFARLLSSLSMTANLVVENQQSPYPLKAGVPLPPTTMTPVQESVGSAYFYQEPSQSLHDLSHTVTKSPDSSNLTPAAPVQSSRFVEVSPAPPAKASLSNVFHRAPAPPIGTHASSSVAHPAPSSLTSSHSAKSPPTRSRLSRRSSSTTDISPYLSRLSEVPVSGKRLKQLALLESVADESAKMVPLSLDCGFLHNKVHPNPPPLPPSAPPLNNDMRLIYSSNPGAVSSRVDFPLVPHSLNSRTLPTTHQNHDSVVQARTRTTSQPLQAATLHLGSRGMFQQDQSMTDAKPQAQTLPVHSAYPQQPLPYTPSQALPPCHVSQIQERGHGLLHETSLNSAPANSLGFEIPHAGSTSQSTVSLLSILNGGRNPVRAQVGH